MNLTYSIAHLCLETLPTRIGAAELANARLCLIDGRPKIATYTNAAVADPAVEALRRKVRIVVPPHLSEAVAEVRRLPFDQPTTISVTQRDGQVFRAVVQYPRGMPQNPVSEADLLDKFADCAAEDFDPSLPGRLAALLDQPDVSTAALLDLLAGAARAS